MTRPFPAQQVAECLLAAETSAGSGSEVLAEATGRVCARLYHELGRMVGATGCDLLLTRAGSLAAAEYPFLQGIRWRSGAEPHFEGLGERLEPRRGDEARGGCVALLEGFISLLVTFIGAELTSRQLERAWPDLSFPRESREPDR